MKKFLSLLLISVICIASVIPCFADMDNVDSLVYEYTAPSVERPLAPEIVTNTVVIDGETIEYAAIIYPNDGGDPIYVPVNEIVITPYLLRNSADDEARNYLNTAFYELSHAKKLSDLCPGLDEVAADLKPGADSSALVVSELFDLSVSEKYLELYLNGVISFTFKTESKYGDNDPIVIHRLAGEDSNWITVDPSGVVDNGDGTITVNFKGLCPVAFLAVSDELAAVKPGSLDTPAASSAIDAPAVVNWVIPAACIALIGGIVGIVVVSKKKTTEK